MRDNDRSIAELLASLCDETISPEEMQRLDHLICTDPAVRRLYMEYLDLHARLSYQFHQSDDSMLSVLPPAAVPFPPGVLQESSEFMPSASALLSPFGSFLFSYSLAAVIVGIGLLIGWVYQVSTTQEFVRDTARRSTTPSRQDRENPFVGRVTGLLDCRWVDPKSAVADYSHVSLGRKYALASGTMEITYDSGVKVILQGPCTYQVESKTGGYLSRGRLTALVETRTHGDLSSEIEKSALFSIRTPTARVTDLGTEFGVDVDKSGMTESHVFRGRVVLTVLQGGKKEGERITLAANESARIERKPGGSSLSMSRRSVDPAGFMRSEQFAVKAKELGEASLKPFRRWQAASEKLRRHKDLLVYYDFQRDPDHPRDQSGYELMRNRAPTGSKFDGRVMGAIRMGMSQGRFQGKDALRFSYASDGVRINIPGQFPRLTFMASIALERSADLSGIVMTDSWCRPDQFHWQFAAGGQILFGWPGPKFFAQAPEASDFSGWHKWAFVYDGPNQRMTAYVDGRRISEWALTKTQSLSIGEATIGNWAPRDVGDPRPLLGRMDEFAIFSGALDDADVKRLHEESGESP
jgi:hypothetical protein